MTRVLSELLGASEPSFQRELSKLEAASGYNATDIRLSAEIERATKLKLKALGLDPHDTTGDELYAALQQKIKADDESLNAVLQRTYGHEADVTALLARALQDLPMPTSCFALKTTIIKQLLKKQPPRHVMKLLGYRSFESMLRREQILAIYAASWVVESTTWRKTLLDAYKRLKASDFEIRTTAVIAPQSERWRQLSAYVVENKKHNVVGLKECGCVILLPLVDDKPPAATLTNLLLVLQEMNEMRSASTYLKFSQVQPDFGARVQEVVEGEPSLGADLLYGPVPWQVIQRYYGRHGDRFRADIFEPHVQKEDLRWHSIEKALSFLEPKLGFWHHTTNLGLLHDHQPVSLNVIDAALNFCNQLPYTNRIVHYFRHNLWHEMIIRYLKHANVEEAVLRSLTSQLVEEPALLYSENW